MRDDVAGPDGSALSEELGPLPEPAMLRGVDEDYYTAEQMRAYGAQERAEERERWAKECIGLAQLHWAAAEQYGANREAEEAVAADLEGLAGDLRA
jgi:hypothetical protein